MSPTPVHRPLVSVPALLLAALLLAGCGAKPEATREAPPAVAETVVAGTPEPVVAVAAAPAAPASEVADAYTDAQVANQSSDEPAPTETSQSETGIDQGEADYAAIYGDPADSAGGATHDPWEPFNRRVHAFNNRVDEHVAKPLARTYVRVVPAPVRQGVTNFFNNLSQPLTAVNAFLQGKPAHGWDALGRFMINSTVGVLGFRDVATRDQVPNRSEDFGQTLAVWGWENSRYLELPLLGPRTLRDAVGFAAEAPLSPLQQMHDMPARVFLNGLQLVDMRTQLMAADSMREGAIDEYTLYRDGWMQRRRHQIFGEREDALPDYLLEAEPEE